MVKSQASLEREVRLLRKQVNTLNERVRNRFDFLLDELKEIGYRNKFSLEKSESNVIGLVSVVIAILAVADELFPSESVAVRVMFSEPKKFRADVKFIVFAKLFMVAVTWFCPDDVQFISESGLSTSETRLFKFRLSLNP